MASPADYLTCLDESCAHAFEDHTPDGECGTEGCECFGYLWPEDE